MLAAIIFAGGYQVWRKVRDRVLASAEYTIGPQQLEITPLPPWIQTTDLRAEVFRVLSHGQSVSILDDDLVERAAKVFSRHPWIVKVLHVSKEYPAKLKVDLLYRKPVCMVEISGGYLLPVDKQGVLLPTVDFTSVEAAKYPRLVGVDSVPRSRLGERWLDSRVLGGAEIAKLLLPYWTDLGLLQIEPVAPSDPAHRATNNSADSPRLGEYQFVILTRQKRMKIIWGASPASNAPGEPSAKEKLNKLRQFAAEHGKLDYPQSPDQLDLRKP
ncbi:MAG: cell division protein FtsQ/DivIB [Thermoguttaceae bacterium]